MIGALVRVAAMAAKELRVVLLDRRVLTTLVISPIIQLLLFGFATTLEVRNVDLGYVNRDSGIAAEQVLAATAAVRQVRSLTRFSTEAELAAAIEARQVLGGLVLPADLSHRVARGDGAAIGLLLDGRRINAAQIVAGYLGEVAERTGAGVYQVPVATAAPRLETRAWFNPNLEYRWFTLPGMITVITAVLVISVSAQSFARERESGTWDELMALPLRSWEILLGKFVPAFCVGLFNGALYVALIPLVSDVPMAGSLALMAISIVCFSFAVTSIGLCISILAQNQQQAFLGGFLVTVPMILLSGYASPVDGMPGWLQPATAANPLSHMLVICHGIFLKDAAAAIVLDRLQSILMIGVVAAAGGWLLLKWRSG